MSSTAAPMRFGEDHREENGQDSRRGFAASVFASPIKEQALSTARVIDNHRGSIENEPRPSLSYSMGGRRGGSAATRKATIRCFRMSSGRPLKLLEARVVPVEQAAEIPRAQPDKIDAYQRVQSGLIICLGLMQETEEYESAEKPPPTCSRQSDVCSCRTGAGASSRGRMVKQLATSISIREKAMFRERVLRVASLLAVAAVVIAAVPGLVHAQPAIYTDWTGTAGNWNDSTWDNGGPNSSLVAWSSGGTITVNTPDANCAGLALGQSGLGTGFVQNGNWFGTSAGTASLVVASGGVLTSAGNVKIGYGGRDTTPRSCPAARRIARSRPAER